MKKSFGEFLGEAFKIYATTKDGVRKQARDVVQAAAIRNSYDNPNNDPEVIAAKKKQKEETDAAVDRYLHRVARYIQDAVSQFYPDSDGFESVQRKVMKDTGTRNPDEANEIINRAARKVLGVKKDYWDYVDEVHKDYTRDNPND